MLERNYSPKGVKQGVHLDPVSRVYELPVYTLLFISAGQRDRDSCLPLPSDRGTFPGADLVLQGPTHCEEREVRLHREHDGARGP